MRDLSISIYNMYLFHLQRDTIRCSIKGKLPMTQINWGRILLGGLLAGIVVNTFEFVLNFFMLKEAWAVAKELKPDSQVLMTGGEIAASNLWGFLVGFLALWLYASIRPRYGSGPRTALYAGTAIWGLVSLLAVLRPTAGTSLAMTAIVTSVFVGFVEINLGTLLGAWQYREADHGAEEAGFPSA